MPAITFYSIDSDRRIIDGALIKVYSLDGDTLHTYGTSDIDGILTLDLPADTYWVRCFKSEYKFNHFLRVTVGEILDEEIDLIGTSCVDYSPSGASNICKVTGILVGASGEPLKGRRVLFTLEKDNYRMDSASIISEFQDIAVSNEFGVITAELIQGLKYSCAVQDRDDAPFYVTVPGREVCSLSDLLFPIGNIITAPTTASGDLDEDIAIPMTMQLSSGRDVEDNEYYYDYFELDHSASVVANVNNAGLIVHSEEPGSYPIDIFGKPKDAKMVTPKYLRTITVTIG